MPPAGLAFYSLDQGFDKVMGRGEGERGWGSLLSNQSLSSEQSYDSILSLVLAQAPCSDLVCLCTRVCVYCSVPRIVSQVCSTPAMVRLSIVLWKRLWIQTAWLPFSAPPPTSCVTLNKLLDLSVPQLSHSTNGENSNTYS